MNAARLALLTLFLILPKIIGAQDRPNVLFIALDDLNDQLGWMGSEQSITPNIDALAATGMRFVNNHTPAGYCTPSRTALMTGMAPWKSGCYGDQPHLYNLPDRKTMDELFKEHGYKVYGGGKIYHHMHGYVNLEGFDEYYIWNDAQKLNGWPYQAWIDNPATPDSLGEMGMSVRESFDIQVLADTMEKEMADTHVADWAVDFLEQEHDKPFFLAVGLYAPHKPNYAPKKYFDMYPLDSIRIPEQIPEGDDLEDLPQYIYDLYRGRRDVHYDEENQTGVLSVENGWKKAIQGYLACCSYADAQVGKVLNQLYQSPYAENTIIVLWSDNGYHLGEKEVWGKHTLWKKTTNVPMLWAGPGIAGDQTYTGVTSLLDILPTLVDLCELPSTQEMDGVSLKPVLNNTQSVVNDSRHVITCKVPDKNGFYFSVTSNNWHYLSYADRAAEELYDTKNDPHEWYNLADGPEYESIVEEMRTYLPVDPAKPGLTRDSGLQLVTIGESFFWKNPAEDRGFLHEWIENAPAGETTTLTFDADDSITINTPVTVDGKEIILDGGPYEVVLDGQQRSSLFKVTSTGKLTLKNLTMENALNATRPGGAIESDGEVHLVNCKFINNKALIRRGGAIALKDVNGYFENCIFSNNSAVGFGGAVTNSSGNLTFLNCLFDHNTVYADNNCMGSAVYNHHIIDDPDAVTATDIINCLFTGNIVDTITLRTGGAVTTGIFNPEANRAKQVVMKVYNSIFWNNKAPSGKSNDVMIYHNAELEIYHSVFGHGHMDSSGVITTDDPEHPFFHIDKGEAEITVVENCLDGTVNSLFGDGQELVYSPFKDEEGGDFHLRSLVGDADNPFLDAGMVEGLPVGLPENDLDGEPRIKDGGIDLGPYEGSFVQSGFDHYEPSETSFHFDQGSGILVLNLPEIIHPGKLEVYTIHGKMIMMRHITSREISISDLIPGIYLAKIIFNENSFTGRIVVL